MISVRENGFKFSNCCRIPQRLLNSATVVDFRNLSGKTQHSTTLSNSATVVKFILWCKGDNADILSLMPMVVQKQLSNFAEFNNCCGIQQTLSNCAFYDVNWTLCRPISFFIFLWRAVWAISMYEGVFRWTAKTVCTEAGRTCHLWIARLPWGPLLNNTCRICITNCDASTFINIQ